MRRKFQLDGMHVPLCGGGWQADGLVAALEIDDASLKRVTHADLDAETSLNLLEAGDLDDDGTRVAERKGFEPLEAFRLQRFSRPPP